MDSFHFLRPAWFLALIPLTLLLWLLWRRVVSSRAWAAVCDPELLPHLLVGEQGAARRLPLLVLGISGLLAILALAGPVWEQREQALFREQSALVVALDLSRSMDAADIKPSRLARARYKLLDILNQRKEGQTALIVYAATPFAITPLTDDNATIAAQVNSLETGLMPAQGSRPDLAVAKAAELLQQAGQTRGDILLLTDSLAPLSADRVLENLGGEKHRISVLAVGTEDGAPVSLPEGGFLKNAAGEIVLPKLESGELKQLARRGGGRFHGLTPDDRDIRYLLSPMEGISNSGEKEETKVTADLWREEGPWLILLLLPLGALAFRRGYLVLPVLFLLPPPPAQAVNWEELWSRPDQQASRTLEQGDAQAAAQQFENPEWKAAAHYRAGEFQQAAKTLEGIDTPDALYNRGNALARSGALPEAIAAYERALELDPGLEDAHYNRKQVKKQLEQQPSRNQETSQDQNQDQDSPDRKAQQGSSQQQNPSDDPGEQQQSQQEPSHQEPGEQGQEQATEKEKQRQTQAERDESKEKDSPAAEEQREEEGREAQEARAFQPADLSEEQQKSDPVTEQWLNRIPDDPGGLLRRKFLYQYKRQSQPPQETQQW